jgi:L-asparaginase
MRKRVAIFFTGGTISMKYDPVVKAALPALSGREILDTVPEWSRIAHVDIVDFGRFPGPHITLDVMMELSKSVRTTLLRSEVDGVVITHGTDTLEETAYLLDLTQPSDKPIVLVGAMRTISEAGWDGPSNLLSAIRVAASDSTTGFGVLVAMNDTILAAAEATKTHTESFDSFQSPDFGPLGVIDKGEIIIRRKPSHRTLLESESLVTPVFLLKMSAGTDSTLFDAAIHAGAKGLIIEGLGRGNVPPECVGGIERALAADIPVILTSRCLRGRVFESYGYKGGAKQLRELGVIFADYLTGQKARIKLALALGSTSRANLREVFEGPTGRPNS